MLSRTTDPGAARPFEQAVLLTALVLALGLACFLTYQAIYRPRVLPADPAVSFWGPNDINAPMLTITPFYDSTGQKRAHLVMLAAIGLLVAPLPLLGWVRNWADRPRVQHATTAIVVVGSGLLLLTPGLYTSTILGHLSCVLGSVLFVVAMLHGRPRVRLLFSTGVFLLLAAAVLPGLWARFDLSHTPWTLVVQMQEHYFSVAGQGDRLAAGLRLFDQVLPYYGVLLPSLVGMLQRHLGMLELGGYLAIIRSLQALFLFLAAFLYFRLGHRCWACCLAALLLAAPVYHFNQIGLLTPNQTAWRTIGFPAGLLAVYLVRRRSLALVASVLGWTSGLVLAINFETGIAIVAGLLTYVWFRYRPLTGNDWQQIAGAAGYFLANLIVFFAAFAFLYRLGLGAWPAAHPQKLAVNAASWQSTGIGGLPFDYDPLAVLIFAHAAFVLLRTTCGTSRPAGFYRSFLCAVAATILVWFAYYAHRVHPMNLTSYFFLYGFLLIDLLRALVSSLRRAELGTPVLVQAAALGFVVAPGIWQTVSVYGDDWWRGAKVAVRGPADPNAIAYSGVFFARPEGEQLRERVRFARAQAEAAPTLLLSADHFLITRLAGIFPAVSFGDLFIESLTKKLYRRRIAEVLCSEAEVLLFDAPDSAAASFPPARAFYDQVKRDLARAYRHERTVSSWEVWRRAH